MYATYLVIKVSPHELFSHIALFTFCSVKCSKIVSILKKYTEFDNPLIYNRIQIVLLRVDSARSFLGALHSVVCVHKLRVGNWC